MSDRTSLIFGYRTVPGIACGNCGSNYIAMEVKNGQDVLRCWCGSTCVIEWDTPEERVEFLAMAEADA